MKKILHFKKHKTCNLYCEGCISSIQHGHSPDINSENNDDIMETLNAINKVTNPHDNVEYSISFLGGEPLMKAEDLDYYLDLVDTYSDQILDYGIQSNLIFEEGIFEKVVENKEKLKHRLGTSYNFNKTRMLGKSHKLFKERFLENYVSLSDKLDYNIPIIVVVTENNVKSIYHIYSFFNERNVDVTFFHFLPMGKKTSYFEYYKNSDFHFHFSKNLIKIAEDKNKKIRVQPIDKIVDAYRNSVEYGCGMQQDCFKKSFCVEASGDIFVCPELSAQNKFPLGNWKTKEVYQGNIDKLRKRMTNVDKECLSCEFYSSCKSGCMAESLVSNFDLYGKTYMCESWKNIFQHLKDTRN